MAGSKNFGTYAADSGLYFVGQSGTNLLIDIATTDITMARWGAFVPAVTDHTLDLRARPGDGDGPRRHQVALGGRHAGHSHTPDNRALPPPRLPDSVGFTATSTYISAGATAAKELAARGVRSSPSSAASFSASRCGGGRDEAVQMDLRAECRRTDGALMQVCSGMVGTTLLVPPQIVVGRREMPLCDAHWGVARRPILASGLASSIMGVVPDSGTPERVAVG
ncbi:hypothetical protein DL766_006798 [Monosporascus sp. MC13-8B]|nr:hypothetical protein DL766_006798 [Monosporascus sp. MC13-8B]